MNPLLAQPLRSESSVLAKRAACPREVKGLTVCPLKMEHNAMPDAMNTMQCNELRAREHNAIQLDG